MPLLCITCESRVERSAADPTVYWCPHCEKELKKAETYKVGKRHFASGLGMILAMTAAMPPMPSLLSLPNKGKTSDQTLSKFEEMRKQKRRKIKGLRMQQRRLTSYKRRKG